ncbi:hypothetical protein VT85_11015 [Planctomyces sp. SH-PL62]|nr:hypothetical protein VT85_11015 [Planctomyces sp. SH-PL62]
MPVKKRRSCDRDSERYQNVATKPIDDSATVAAAQARILA